MSGFKGAKGKWFVGTGAPNGIELHAYRVQVDNDDEWDICAVWDDVPSANFNALLISKAPEMIEMLEKMVENWGSRNETDMLIEAKQLIKDATTI